MSARRTYTPNERTVEAYTEGDCWHLALTIHRRTGWPAIFACPDDPSLDALYWEHAAVLMPDGRVLDIEGAHPRAQWALKWGARTTVVHETAELLEQWLDDQERIFLTDTSSTATRLLRAYASQAAA